MKTLRQAVKLIGAGFLMMALGPIPTWAQIQIQGLGFLPSGSATQMSQATAVSSDGSVVAGFSRSANGDEPFRWTATGGMVGLGFVAGDTSGRAAGISADGSTVIGYSGSTSGTEAFRWTSAGGMQGLGDLPGGLDAYSDALAVSADGSVVVGYGYTANGQKAYRWTAGGGMVALSPDGSATQKAIGVSPDGAIVVGFNRDVPNGGGVKWSGGSVISLGDLPGGDAQSIANAVSADGRVVVGWSSSANGSSEAFRWTAEGGMMGLGDLPAPDFHSEALGVTADGSVVVGTGDRQNRAFIWTESGGMEYLSAYLSDRGVDMSGWAQLVSATAISADGNAIVGYGIRNGYSEAFVITGLTAVPEPSTYALVAGGIGLAFAWRKRKRMGAK